MISVMDKIYQFNFKFNQLPLVKKLLGKLIFIYTSNTVLVSDKRLLMTF